MARCLVPESRQTPQHVSAGRSLSHKTEHTFQQPVPWIARLQQARQLQLLYVATSHAAAELLVAEVQKQDQRL